MVILRIVDGGGSVFKFKRGGRGLDVGAGLFAFFAFCCGVFGWDLRW